MHIPCDLGYIMIKRMLPFLLCYILSSMEVKKHLEDLFKVTYGAYGATSSEENGDSITREEYHAIILGYEENKRLLNKRLRG
ncbi:hypothetical protein L1987_42622 [Smallanthus sonchifolius]|uniref:Uncharacterized protein n=1 Tax=Smallanthus sonchifolius TaxID=185202 RepID=A0ACB9GK46_9ASTR|nr:hypothetical protein L1987_42622 [Smallanthus sonchifolius]